MTAKYKGLLDDIKEKQAGTAPAAAEPPPPSPAPTTPAEKTPKAVPEKRKVGRPKVGKSSNPDFEQTTAYVEIAVHLDVKKALLEPGMKGIDYSDVVNYLLKKWMKSPIKPPKD